ncbi:class I glutamine amidotransferase-like protein [Paraphoma chrysanthemicola]|nr:class I glutamine amidotransferase-like protein [Paraphoma chrysanthemicola]
MMTSLRICMLNADVPVPAVAADRAPTYGQIFHQLLSAAARQTSPEIEITSQDFDVMKEVYPVSLANYDAIIISGSANSAYDDLPWVHKLNDYVLDVYRNEPRIKIFGSCFGHQLMCQSLLSSRGAKVEPDPKGWEIGVQNITLHDRFRTVFGKSKETGFDSIASSIRLQFVHHDHVVLPTSESLPPTWMTVGSTEHCAVQGVYEPGRILTLQGHFEFDKFINMETVMFFFPKWEPEVLGPHLEAIDAEDDAVAAAKIVIRFLLEMEGSEAGVSHKVIGGLLTPPLIE